MTTKNSTKNKRTASVKRKTKETQIELSLNLDGTGACAVSTGVGFLDHMIEQLATHSLIDIKIKANGDLHIDSHHLGEDIGITLGEALDKALGERRGIRRFGSATAPLDEALCRAVVDLGGRSFVRTALPFTQASLGNLDTEVISEFFAGLTRSGRFGLHLDCLAKGNNHHMAEAGFKATALALRWALEIDPKRSGLSIPSSKGVI